jgi:3-dehydroquinate dehydratase type I
MRSERSLLRELIENKNGTRIVLSFHDFQRTLSSGELRKLSDRMIRYGADVAKIVTFARSWEDNLKVLALIPHARKRNQAIVAFCMGEKGKMSRIFAPLMGAAWTYASLSRERASAAGQLTVEKMREIWERLE